MSLHVADRSALKDNAQLATQQRVTSPGLKERRIYVCQLLNGRFVTVVIEGTNFLKKGRSCCHRCPRPMGDVALKKQVEAD
jgi:hypothetical protein